MILCSVAGLCMLVKLGSGTALSSAQASPESKPAKPIVFQEQWRAEVRAVAQKFLAAAEPGDLLPLIRNADKLGPKVIKFYEASHSLPLGRELKDTFVVSEASNGDPLVMLLFVDKAGKDTPLVVARTAEGLKVDWPSLTGIGDMSLAEFIQQRPETPTLLHVTAWSVDYYSFDYADEGKYLCLRLTDAADDHALYGYLPRAQIHDVNQLAGVLPLSKATEHAGICPQGITLEARFPADKVGGNQAEIVRVICPGWYLP